MIHGEVKVSKRPWLNQTLQVHLGITLGHNIFQEFYVALVVENDIVISFFTWEIKFIVVEITVIPDPHQKIHLIIYDKWKIYEVVKVSIVSLGFSQPRIFLIKLILAWLSPVAFEIVTEAFG